MTQAIARIEPKMALTTRYEPTNLEEAMQLASRISKSGLCPEALRGKDADVLMVLMKGSEMGLTSMQALQNLYVIHGRIGCTADLLRARAQDHPDCVRFEIVEATRDKAVLEVLKSGWTEPIRVTWTLEDARRAGLLRQGSSHEKWPEEMNVARVTSRAARRYFPEVCAGIYAKEELESEVTSESTPEPPQPKKRSKAAAIVASLRPETPLEGEIVPEPIPEVAPEPDRGSETILEAEPTAQNISAEDSDLFGPLTGKISQDTADEIIEEYMRARGVNAGLAESQVKAALYRRYNVERIVDLPLVAVDDVLRWAKVPPVKRGRS